MSRIGTPVRRDETFEANTRAQRTLVAELKAHLERIRAGGSESARARHTQRGRLLVRERIEYYGLGDDAEAWERGADDLMEEDDEIAAHVAQLESMVDEAALPEASGDAIAAEFEKYLRRRDFGK